MQIIMGMRRKRHATLSLFLKQVIVKFLFLSKINGIGKKSFGRGDLPSPTDHNFKWLF